MAVSVSKEQYDRACSVDLYEFLIKNHGYAVKVEYGSALLLADKHVSVKKGFHGYKNFRNDESGNNIDYLMNFLGYDYQGAVLALTGESGIVSDYVPVTNPALPEGPKEINLPKATEGQYRNLYAFLLARKIPPDVIQLLINQGIMYQSAEGNNIVFVTPQGDYCELRGTNTYADRRCKARSECQKYQSGEHNWCKLMASCDEYKPDSFHGCRKTQPDRFWYFAPEKDKPSEEVYVCEAAIDAISLYVIHRSQKKDETAVYVSIGGVANQKTIDRLVRGKKNVILAVDNDQAGQDCRDRNPNLKYILPKNKDWNDDLKKGDF